MFMNEKGNIFVLEADETFCDCCGVLWKKHSITEDALTGKHLCAPCLAHGEQEECPIMSNLKKDTMELESLALRELQETRRKVADVFLAQYIECEDDSQAAIDAIAELIACGGDLEKIIQRLALDVEL